MKVGDIIDDFDFKAYHKGKFVNGKLSDYNGKWAILFFYPEDFTFICPTELRAFAQKMKAFEEEDAVLIGCSTDSVNSHKAWFERDLKEIEYPVIGDTSHQITNMFEILQDNGIALRGTFIIDPEGKLRYEVVSDNDVGRSVEETFRVLKALKTGKLCPVEWKPDQDTLKGN